MMKNIRFMTLILLSLMLVFAVSAQTKKKPSKPKTPKGKPIKVMPKQIEPELPTGGNVGDKNMFPKVVATQTHCGAENPFVFVARDRETYLNVQKRLEKAPAPFEIDFEKTAVIVAFAGTKPNPGYGISFKNNGEGVVKIDETVPPKDAMLADVLTSPCAVALVPLGENKSLTLEVNPNFAKKAEVFRVTSGEFTKSGGFIARQTKLQFEGTISVWKWEGMLTAVFDLRGKGPDKGKILRETASGTMQSEDNVFMARLDPNGFVETPFAPVKVIGKMTKRNLSLSFEPLPTSMADGFEIAGKLEAVR